MWHVRALLSAVVVGTVMANVCYVGKEPDLSGKMRWVLPYRDLCACTEIRPGGVNMQAPRRSFLPKYLDSLVITKDRGEIMRLLYCAPHIGGWSNWKSVIQPFSRGTWSNLVAQHNERGLLSVEESRPFWIEYKEGNVTVGKGGQEAAFLQWDAGAYHGRVLSVVHVGIASWLDATEGGDWVIYQYCG